MLLPHGYEGQGPDHASARPERFLQLAADINMRVANCTTAAQYFHLLRRQALLLVKDPLPLVVLTPKSLLRHPFVSSTPRDLAEGRWMKVIDDAEALARAKDVRRLVFCSGKVAVDLFVSPHRTASPTRRRHPRRAALSAASQRDAPEHRQLPEPRGSALGAGRAGEHGRVGLRAAVARWARRDRAGLPCWPGRGARAPPRDRRRVTRRIRNGSSRARSRWAG